MAADRRAGDGGARSEAAEAVAVRVAVPGHGACELVDAAVAVVVEVVADLDLPRVHGAVGVVAVLAHGREAGRPGARHCRARGVAVAVAVGVREARDEQALVGAAVAVVVEAVAGLERVGPHGEQGVVAVGAARRAVAARRVEGVVAVAVALAEGRGVAVLVDAVDVADLGGAGEARRVRVVAVVAAARDGRGAVAVGVARDRALRDAGVGRFVAGLRGHAGLRARRDAAARVGARCARVAALGAVAEDAVVALCCGTADVAEIGAPEIDARVGRRRRVVVVAARGERKRGEEREAHGERAERTREAGHVKLRFPAGMRQPRDPRVANEAASVRRRLSQVNARGERRRVEWLQQDGIGIPAAPQTRLE